MTSGPAADVPDATDDTGEATSRAQMLYWQQLVELKGLSVFIRLYRDDQSRWIRRIGLVKAFATSSTIAGWSIWKDYALVWGIILALSQLVDAIKEYLPHQKQQRAASDLAASIEILFVDALFDWSAVSNGTLDTQTIMARWKHVAKLRIEAERKFFPDGIARRERLQSLALDEANAYFRTTFGIGDQR